MTVLAAREGYRLWAPTYASENAITHLEQGLAAAATPPLSGLRLLDAGCGTGRRLRNTGAASAIGVDLSPEMLEAGRDGGDAWMIVGDIRSLPLPDRSFDVVWCRLVVGHLPECRRAYAELARVADAGARVIVTDFHPSAYEAGHRRTFRAEGAVHEVEHHVHQVADHLAAASAAGLIVVGVEEAVIGREVRSFYEEAGWLARYDEHRGLPVVLALTFQRDG